MAMEKKWKIRKWEEKKKKKKKKRKYEYEKKWKNGKNEKMKIMEK